MEALVQPDYFTQTKTLFPVWPVWDPMPALTLLGGTAVVLFLPKFCALFLALFKGRRTQFGGFFGLCGSIVAEVILSTLLAPIRMLFHSKFVFLTLAGMGIGWGTQQRDDAGTTFWDALRFHGGGTVLAVIWGLVLFEVNRVFFWWSSPLIFSLLLSIPVSMISSHAEMGRLFRRLRLFVTPEETRLPREYEDIEAYLTANQGADFGLAPTDGFARAAVDPGLNLLHRHLLRGPRTVTATIAARRDALLDKALEHGPNALNKKEKKELLYDPERMARLHERIWSLPEGVMAERWKIRLR